MAVGPNLDCLAVAAGALLMGTYLSRHFGKVHRERVAFARSALEGQNPRGPLDNRLTQLAWLTEVRREVEDEGDYLVEEKQRGHRKDRIVCRRRRRRIAREPFATRARRPLVHAPTAAPSRMAARTAPARSGYSGESLPEGRDHEVLQ